MPSNAAKGAYYKRRTWKWLESLGYAVAHLERTLPAVGTRRFPIKVDQLGADLLAVSAARVVFVQVKHFGPTHRWATRRVMEARVEFARHPLPPGAEQWIVVWGVRQRTPQVIRVAP
jgi:hypothetical protein